MKRRKFIKYGGAVSLGVSPLFKRPAGDRKPEIKVKAKDIQAYLLSLNGGWVDLEKTVDTFKAGDPEVAVTGIGVGWMSYIWALKRTMDMGMNMFITHEPTYFAHRDNDPTMFEIEGIQAKRKFIEDKGIVILRCHDLWDQYPDIGIPDGWARFLGLTEPVAGTGHFRAFDVTGKPAGEIARTVAEKVSKLGQQAVQLIGSETAEVKRVAIGCGAITPYLRFLKELKADLAICSDDGFTYWRDGALAIDLDLPVIIVNHPVTEEFGMKLLADHLSKRFPQVPIEHIPQRCMYRLIGG